jgi:hypothetical protein
MTQDEIIEMARQVGIRGPVIDFHKKELEAFAKLVAEKAHEEFGLPAVGILERIVARAVAKEREACAKACGKLADEALVVGNEDAVMCFEEAEDLIRARAQADGGEA